MEPWLASLLAALAPALAQALYEVGKEVVAKPLIGAAAEQFKGWVRRGYDAREKAERVRGALRDAIEGGDADRWAEGGSYPLARALHRLAEEGQDALRERTVAAALTMTADEGEEVPVELLRALGLDEEDEEARADLAHFLWRWRQELVLADEDYERLVALAGRDEVQALLRRLAGAVTDVAGEPALRVQPVGPEAREIEASYLRSLVEGECRYVHLGGRDPRASSIGGPAMQLQKVYVALKTTKQPPEARRAWLSPGEAERGPGAESLSALRVFLDRQRLVLLGEPGSGKSTFADHLALCLAGERLEPGTGWADYLRTHDVAWEGPAPLPLRLRLRRFAADTESLPTAAAERGQAQHLLAYLRRVLEEGGYHTELPSHVLRLLDEGQAVLILDGLDEVGDPARRAKVAQAIADLAQVRFRRAPLLVTCRVRQYRLSSAGQPADPWVLPGFPVARLADFDREQIEDFITAWFAELCALGRFSGEVRDHKVETLKEAIDDRPDLQEIAPRPILLTQMALVHDIEGELPATRVALYAQCADLLLWKWEQLRAQRAGREETAERFIRDQMRVPGLRRDELQSALDRAIYEAHKAQGAAEGGPADIPEETLRRYLAECVKWARMDMDEDEALGKAQFFIEHYLRRRNGLIVPAGERTFQTPHRSFQEFLAGRWLQAQREFDREAPRLVRENPDLWREVFVLAVAQARLGDGVDAVDLLCDRSWPEDDEGWQRLIVAGQALHELGLPKAYRDPRGPETARRVMRFLRRTMQDTGPDGEPNEPPLVPVPTRYAAAEALDRLGWLPEDLNTWVEVPRGPTGVYVGRYPVTNAQFGLFVDAGGYSKEDGRQWWSEEGWAWRERGERLWSDRGTDKPEYWDHPRFGRRRRGYPVVGVSWYEASAYCAWLTALLRRLRAGEELPAEYCALVEGLAGKEVEEVRLPTDAEWEAAAGGTVGGRYPWGTEWDESHTNTAEGGLGGTTPVGMYPSGRSEPYRLWDMAGNVWEWMEYWYDEEHRYPALRGGSWSLSRNLARVAARGKGDPDGSYDDVGFRVVGSPARPGC